MSQADLALPPVLDACCGERSFWFDRADPRALFIDKRRETLPIDVGTPGTKGRAPIVVDPDQVADFTALPFEDETFSLVVFDPPHVQRKEALGILTRRYGHLTGDWREMLRKGFRECFRVLKPNGVLVFKWAESQFRVAEILKLTPAKPLFGHHTSKTTHWAVFIKSDDRPVVAVQIELREPPTKPKECEVACPPEQVCDYCQGEQRDDIHHGDSK